MGRHATSRTRSDELEDVLPAVAVQRLFGLSDTASSSQDGAEWLARLNTACGTSQLRAERESHVEGLKS